MFKDVFFDLFINEVLKLMKFLIYNITRYTRDK